MKRAASYRKTDGQHPALTRVTTAGQAGRIRNPTTSFLTAATLIYAIGAGITAAAGHLNIVPDEYRKEAHPTPDQLVLTALTGPSTLTGGLARSLSIPAHTRRVHPHLSARYDGHLQEMTRHEIS